MTPEKVYERFLKEFPDMANRVVKFNSRRDADAAGSIILLLRNHRTLTFSVRKDGTWILKRG